MYDASLTTELPRYAWAAIAVVWGIAACFAKQTVRTESRGRRMVEFSFLMIAFSLLFNPALRPGVLGMRVLPASGVVPWIGVAATFAGIGFSIWARFYLGGNWSATVTVKRDHTLVRSGPYAIVRHPIYAGLVLAVGGTAVAFGEVGCFVAPPLLVWGWSRKWRLEEEFMQQEFGAEYTEYSGSVKRLIPFVW